MPGSDGLDLSTPTRFSNAPVSYNQSFVPSVLQLDESGATKLIHIDDSLSPVTVESHQAPSLVSDNEDDEFEVASDSDNFSSRSSNDGLSADEDEDDDIEVEDDEASTASKKTTHEVTTFKRSQEKKRERVLPPAVVSLNPGGQRQNATVKSKRARNHKKTN
jgi:ADA HAT complex component 1